ncbi:MAG: hypothetical protein ACKVLI_05890 [Alphaproteobacteria bacterium]|jgi:hypothetical protein|nr:hypothetical protein [Hyphomicrobiales bacterium]|tara:strand:- start:4285 stop:4587 length:303 start_codon:yes stop_codon:yes gene_type:complete
MDKKNQLKNVAFGGDWSESIKSNDEISIIVKRLENIYKRCSYEYIQDSEFNDILDYVEDNIEKGEIFSRSFQKNLRHEDPLKRKSELLKTINLIKKWVRK